MTFSLALSQPSERWYRILLGAAAFVVVAAGIRQAAGPLDSILLASLLAGAVVPVFDNLRRRGVSKGLAVILTTILLVCVVVALLGFLGVAGTRLIQMLPAYQERALAMRQLLEGWL